MISKKQVNKITVYTRLIAALQISRNRNFSLRSRIKSNSRKSRRSIDLFTGEDPVRSINYKVLIFTDACNESQTYCLKPKKSSSSEESSRRVEL